MGGWKCILCLVLAICLAAAQTEKRLAPVEANQAAHFNRAGTVGVAVLVGVGKYPQYSGLGELHYPARDVDLVASSLKRQRYVVIALKDSDATKGAVMNAIKQAGEAMAGENPTIIFFFSGHGFAIDGENYLATLDADINNLASSGLSVKTVEQALVNTQAPRRVIWLDACRDERGKGVGEARSFTNLQASNGTRILLSTKAGRISYEDDKLQQGTFSYFLAKGLDGEAAGPDGLVTFQDLSFYVTQQVRAHSAQTGPLQVPYEAGEASGDFLLARTLTATPPNGAPAGIGPSLTPSSTQPVNPVTHPVVSPPIGNASADEVALFQAAVRSNDANEMEATANKITNPYMANGLRIRAQRLRESGGKSTPAPINLSSTRMAADQLYEQKNYARAFPLYQQAATAGDAHSMAGLGLLYYNGWGTQVDYAAAARYFQQAAQLGETSIVSLLGSMYTVGKGVSKNAALALKYNRQGADLGDASSMYLMGWAYFNGFGVPVDRNQAVAWYRKAAAQGYLKAQGALLDMGVRP